VWEELVKIGVFNAKAFSSGSGENEGAQGSVQEQSLPVEKPAEEERWQAEDSFA